MKNRNTSYNRAVLGLWILTTLFSMWSCEQYLEVDTPTDQVVGEVIFDNAANVEASFADIYVDLRESAFTTGSAGGISYLMGLYTDELSLVGSGQQEARTFYDNSLLASSSSGQRLWDTGYALVYKANRILEGVGSSNGLTQNDRDRFRGEAYFIRAFAHFNLYYLFGDIPYIETTDYRINQDVSRDDGETVYQKIVADLLLAKELVPSNASDPMHFRPDHQVAAALLSRVYLSHGDWQLAIDEAEYLILENKYGLEPDLDQVFHRNSAETLWQLDSESEGINTREAYNFVILSAPPMGAILSRSLLDSFEEGDQRRTQWVGSISEGTDTWYFPFKYQLYAVTATTDEFSILFRLTELYLNAAEASARLGDLDKALFYLNAVRERAGLLPVSDMGQKEALDAIFQERRVEFFSEQGHRFFDLKRSGKIDEVLNLSKPQWDTTDVFLPIPSSELINNPNLLPQNHGY